MPPRLTASATGQAVLTNDLVQRLTVAAGRHAKHEPALGGHEGHLLRDVAADHVLPHLEAGGDVRGEDEDGIRSEERLGEREPAIGAVVQRTLEPLVGRGVGAVGLERDHEPGEARDALGAHRVPLVGHRARSDLLRLERLEQLALVLQQAKIAGHLGGRLRHTAERVEHHAVRLARVGLPRDGELVPEARAWR